MYSDLTLKKYISELSSDKPIPGGGGTSALVASLGISLEIMVARISLKKQEGERQKNLEEMIKQLEKLRDDAEQVIDLDPKVYQEVMSSYGALKGAKDQKQAEEEIERSLSNSFRLQADLALLIVMAKQFLNTVDSFAKGSIRNDLIVSSAFLDGAFKGAVATARINVVYMKNPKQKEHSEEALKKLEERYHKIHFS